jgi:hypothetical protein
MSPNGTCNGSWESYRPYLLPKKVSKNPKFIAFIAACPNQQKSILDNKDL